MSAERLFRLAGSLSDLPVAERLRLCNRDARPDDRVSSTTASIMAYVRDGGDSALRALAHEFDHVQIDALEIPPAQLVSACRTLAPALREALEYAARSIEAVHRPLLPRAQEVEPERGVRIGLRPDPLARVGVYAPGGSAAYPSSVLMGVIPARIAGVGEVIVCSPPDASGQPSRAVMAAAAIAGADRLFAVGGAGAIAAMAWGTESVPRVDRIVGPGNAWVAEAKRQVSGHVGIDSPAGPSELLIIADESADPAHLAREAMAQAEHGSDSSVVLISPSTLVLNRFITCIARELDAAPRGQFIRESLARNGAVLTVSSVEQAVTFANEYAAEHVLLSLVDPEPVLRDLRHAGTVCFGTGASVVLGDYITGANHVLPTGGRARSYSGLSTRDFVRWTTWQRVDRDAATHLGEQAARIADSEGLGAHARAARDWGIAS
jgi:histidinol dehydrogenase